MRIDWVDTFTTSEFKITYRAERPGEGDTVMLYETVGKGKEEAAARIIAKIRYCMRESRSRE